ncbi:emp24/gp25L/p24 family/GOLD family protein [Striga asiatica]|uniref:Emp24/gp25L/p24 family/GOLD family protein n=1 Tax=Striga asiatica TaxID=4170 RepID=A0A5A7QC75_STRAF|nr:emp24/gp25L/p24 family/GOLD family protein [Striga asiatica]
MEKKAQRDLAKHRILCEVLPPMSEKITKDDNIRKGYRHSATCQRMAHVESITHQDCSRCRLRIGRHAPIGHRLYVTFLNSINKRAMQLWRNLKRGHFLLVSANYANIE